MVSFNAINPLWKVPGVSVEVDPSLAGTPINPKFALLAGYKTSAGSAPADVPIACGTEADADTLAGVGSQLARMFRAFFKITKSTPIYLLPIAESGGGTAATGTITVASPPSAAGTLYLYVAGQRIAVGIGASDTSNQVATNIATAINAATQLPVTASPSTNVVTLTCKWKGIDGNDIRMEANYLGFNGGEIMPTGLALTFSGSGFLASGAGVPTWTTAIANLGDAPYKFVGMSLNDSGSFTSWDTEYGFTDSGRWGWLRQSYGFVMSAKRDTYANLITYGPTQNFAVISAMAIETTAPSPIWEWTGAYCAEAARGFSADAARPLQRLTLDGILPAPKATRFNKTQLNALAGVGLAIQGTDVDGFGDSGIPMILREQSRYQKNSSGVADNAYELTSTLSTLDEVLTRLRQSVTNKYPRHKLANDDTRFGEGQAIVTAAIVKGELIAQYAEMEFDGLVENRRAFKDNLIVVRSTTEPNTLECVYPPDLINQLRRFNVKAQFRLQFPTVV